MNQRSRVRPILWLLVMVSSVQMTLCKTIAESNQITIKSLPKIITLQTYKDWSSRLGTNQSTPQSAALIVEESKKVLTTTDYSDELKSIPSMMSTTTEKTEPLSTDSGFSQTRVLNRTKESDKPVNAHNIAAQVLSRIIHISPLLALASNGVPHRHSDFNRTLYEPKKVEEEVERLHPIATNLRSIDSLNEVDIDSSVGPFKVERVTTSVIPLLLPFPTTPPTTTLSELSIPIPENTSTEQPEYAEEDHNHDQDHNDEEESVLPEDQDDYDDDEEDESYRYPVRVSFDDVPEGPPPERESSAPFVMPNIDLNPESLKQKGCRTVVKEVQAIPIENQMTKSSANNGDVVSGNKGQTRTKREADNNARKFTSILMTKECHFPGDEGASSEEVPQTVPSTFLPSIASTTSDSKREVVYQTPTPPNYDDYDEDFAGLDFRPKLRYTSSDMEDLEPKSSNDRKSYADKPSFGRDGARFVPPKDEFGFDDPLFYDFGEGFYNKNNHKNHKNKLKNRNKNRSSLKSSPSRYDSFDDEDFGPKPKSSRTKSRGSKPAIYRSQRPRILNAGKEKAKNGSEKQRKPKKINRSFAFFRTAEPKDKNPNENDFSLSYGTGNFQSFSDSYDSDRDGPRKPGKKMLSDDDDDD